MDTSSLLFRRVEYRMNWADWGAGLVVEYHEETGTVVVVDEDSGTRWSGSEDHVELLED